MSLSGGGRAERSEDPCSINLNPKKSSRALPTGWGLANSTCNWGCCRGSFLLAAAGVPNESLPSTAMAVCFQPLPALPSMSCSSQSCRVLRRPAKIFGPAGAKLASPAAWRASERGSRNPNDLCKIIRLTIVVRSVVFTGTIEHDRGSLNNHAVLATWKRICSTTHPSSELA